MKELDAFDLRQDLLVEQGVFVVRLTREMPNGQTLQYEDRGTLDAGKSLTGTSGFGGKLRGQLLPNGSIFNQGEEGDASFVMVATKMAPDHYRCFRRIEVRRPTKFGMELVTGVYYLTTEDFLEESADEPPLEMKVPLKR